MKNRVATTLDEIKVFIGERQSELERRKSKLLQTSGFRDETRAMGAALVNIQQLLSGGRNISHIFWEIDKYLNAYKVDDPLSRLHTRTQLADARDEFMCTFHDSIHGTRLSELLDILYFMPFAFWRSRGLERRNYRSPSAAEILQLLAELGRLRVDFNRIDTVQLAAIIRIQLGITPRMDYHKMSANRLAEQLTDGETLTRFTAKAMPPDEGYCRAAGGILANIRRWSAEFFGSTGWLAPAEIEAEMLQIVFLAGETVRIAGTEPERPTDFLWLLSTVIASSHTTLKDVLTWPAVKNTRYTSVAERILGTKTYLDRIAVLADRILVARWSQARVELNSSTGRSEIIAAKRTHEYGEFTELEKLKEQRLVAGKSLIKISDSLQLIEPALLDVLANPEGLSELPLINDHLRTLDPGRLMDRNRTISEETKLVTRQELDKLRVLIGRITTISRQGFAASPDQEALDRARATDKPARKTADGVEIGTIPAVGLQAMLVGSLRKAMVTVRDSMSKVEGARKRSMKSDLIQTLNVLYEKIRKAADSCDRIESEAVDAASALTAAATIAPLLREIMMAQTNFNARLNNAKLTPAERQPLTTLFYTMKTRLSDNLRDIEGIRAELAERFAETVTEPHGAADHAAAESAAEQPEVGRGADAPREEATTAAVGAQEAAVEDAAGRKMARLASDANAGMRPVKEMMTRLNAKFAEKPLDDQAIPAAARELIMAIAAARELLTGNLALVETLAATVALTSGEYAGKFDRWQGQLAAVEEETERLLKATERVAEIKEVVRTAVVLEEEISDGEDILWRCGRCTPALETITRAFERLREAREVCAAAAGAKWRLLKGASAHLESSGADFDACEAALKRCQTWIEELRTILCS